MQIISKYIQQLSFSTPKWPFLWISFFRLQHQSASSFHSMELKCRDPPFSLRLEFLYSGVASLNASVFRTRQYPLRIGFPDTPVFSAAQCSECLGISYASDFQHISALSTLRYSVRSGFLFTLFLSIRQYLGDVRNSVHLSILNTSKCSTFRSLSIL